MEHPVGGVGRRVDSPQIHRTNPSVREERAYIARPHKATLPAGRASCNARVRWSVRNRLEPPFARQLYAITESHQAIVENVSCTLYGWFRPCLSGSSTIQYSVVPCTFENPIHRPSGDQSFSRTLPGSTESWSTS